jgi:hypothetical protein
MTYSGDTVVNKGCGGGNPLLAYQYIATTGLVPWTAYPYEEKVVMMMMMMMMMVVMAMNDGGGGDDNDDDGGGHDDDDGGGGGHGDDDCSDGDRYKDQHHMDRRSTTMRACVT